MQRPPERPRRAGGRRRILPFANLANQAKRPGRLRAIGIGIRRPDALAVLADDGDDFLGDNPAPPVGDDEESIGLLAGDVPTRRPVRLVPLAADPHPLPLVHVGRMIAGWDKFA